MSVRSWIAASCALLCAVGAHAQTATLLKDINTTTDVSYSSQPGVFAELRGVAYFFASSSPQVRGLWRTDGTAAGTWLVKDHLDGYNMLEYGGVLLFAANDGVHGSELWKSDGTPEGTALVKDVVPGPLGGVYHRMVAIEGTVFFLTNVEGFGQALWKTDGTGPGTVAVKDLAPDSGPAGELLGSLDGVLYLTAWDEIYGTELWKSDGTPAGTTIVRDINPGPGNSTIYGFAVLNDSFLFSAVHPNFNHELWRSDGTTSGTSLVVDLDPGGNGVVDLPLAGSSVFNGLFYFSGDNGDGSGRGLWRTDGTASGTGRVVEGVYPVAFAASGNVLYFLTDGGKAGTDALWKTDGTALGSTRIKDFPGGVYPRSPDASPYGAFAKLNGAIYFIAAATPGNYELWKADGTGATVVSQIGAGGFSDQERAEPFNPFLLRSNPLFGGKLLFTADDGIHGEELWASNGSPSGTVLVKDIGVASGDSNPAEFQVIGSELYFTASAGLNGRTQWKTNGTAEGTVPTSAPPPVPQAPGFYAFNDGINGRELWKTDGTVAGTRLVKDINPGPDGSVTESLDGVMSGGTFFFPANDGINGTELWKSDGTATGTVMVRNIHASEGVGSLPNLLIDFNGTLIFRAASGISTSELWRSDGTEAGTALIQANLPPGFFQPTLTNGVLFYLSWSPGGGYQLWRTDGTAQGTLLLKDLFGAFQPQPEIIDLQGRLFFTFQNQLWASDGTLGGTVLLKSFDRIPGYGSAYPLSQFTKYNGNLYLLVRTAAGPNELWKSDGTEEGTTRVGDLPAPMSSVSNILGVYAGSLFLDVTNFWYSAPHRIAAMQGTAESTILKEPLFVGEIELFAGAGPNVHFAARTEEYGEELWALPLQPAISSGGVVDAAGYLPTLAPGGLASLFGVELAAETIAASGFPLPTTLAGAKVQVNGIDAPVLFVSPTQINFQVPYGTPLGASVSIIATLNGQQSLSEPTAVAEFAPAIFVNPATGEPIVQRHADGSLISAQNPAQPGDTLVLYVTGIGGLDHPPATGAAATNSPLAMATTPPVVFVGGVEVGVLFAGLAPGFAGLGQINIQLPEILPQGSPLPLTIRFGASESPTLELPFLVPCQRTSTALNCYNSPGKCFIQFGVNGTFDYSDWGTWGSSGTGDPSQGDIACCRPFVLLSPMSFFASCSASSQCKHRRRAC